MDESAEAAPPPRKAPPLPLRLARMAALVVLGFTVIFSLVLLGCQRQMIFPTAFVPPSVAADLPPEILTVEFETSQGRQVAFYQPPLSDPEAIPSPLWVCFNGNASAAVHWLDFIHNFPDRAAGFLLVDYPGYALCEGKPSPRAITESSAAAMEALAEALGVEEEALHGDLRTLGYSMGAAAALDFATRRPVRQAVVISPFTSLLDMAKRAAPWPFHHLLLHRYDNMARLAELRDQDEPPRVAVFHGSNDPVIPVEHGRRMAAEFPALVDYTEVTGGDHDAIIFSGRDQIIDTMTRQP